MNNEDFYSKLPNKLLIPTEDDKSIYQLIKDDKVLLILDYLYIHTNRINESVFSINDIVTYYNFKIDTHKNKTNDKFKDSIKKLIDIGILEVNFNINKIKNNEFLKCKIHIDYSTKYIELYRSELNKILSCDKLDRIKLLKLYCYLKGRIYKREDNKSITATGGKASVCYPSYKRIYVDIGISEGITIKYINKLKELKLIAVINPGVYYSLDDFTIKKESNNIYALYDDEGTYKDELKEAAKWFRGLKIKEGYVFTKEDKKYKNNNRKLNGELGALTRLKNKKNKTNKRS